MFSSVYFFHPSPHRNDHWVLPALTPSNSGIELRSDSEKPSKSGDRIPGRKTGEENRRKTLKQT